MATANKSYKILRALVAVLTNGDEGLDETILAAAKRAGLPYTKSRLQGWRVSPGSKNFQKMEIDDLELLAQALVDYFRD